LDRFGDITDNGRRNHEVERVTFEGKFIPWHAIVSVTYNPRIQDVDLMLGVESIELKDLRERDGIVVPTRTGNAIGEDLHDLIRS